MYLLVLCELRNLLIHGPLSLSNSDVMLWHSQPPPLLDNLLRYLRYRPSNRDVTNGGAHITLRLKSLGAFAVKALQHDDKIMWRTPQEEKSSFCSDTRQNDNILTNFGNTKAVQDFHVGRSFILFCCMFSTMF